MKTKIAILFSAFCILHSAFSQTTNWIEIPPTGVNYYGGTVNTNGVLVWSDWGASEKFADVQKHWFFDGNGNIVVNADGTLSTNGIRFDDEDIVLAVQYQPETNPVILATNPCAVVLWTNQVHFTDGVYEVNHGETREQGAFRGFYLFKAEIDFSPPVDPPPLIVRRNLKPLKK